MWYSICKNCPPDRSYQEQIMSEAPEGQPWLHTVWLELGKPPELREACPSAPGFVGEPTEGMLIEFPPSEGG